MEKTNWRCGRLSRSCSSRYRIGTLDPGDTLDVVAAAFEPVHHAGDTFQTEPAGHRLCGVPARAVEASEATQGERYAQTGLSIREAGARKKRIIAPARAVAGPGPGHVTQAPAIAPPT